MIPAKLATQGYLKIKVFWNKSYYVIISVHNVTNKILSHDSNYMLDLVLWPKIGNYHFYEASYNLNFIRIWSEKHFFCGECS